MDELRQKTPELLMKRNFIPEADKKDNGLRIPRRVVEKKKKSKKKTKKRKK